MRSHPSTSSFPLAWKNMQFCVPPKHSETTHRMTWNSPLNYCGQKKRSTASYTRHLPMIFYKFRLPSAWFPFIAASLLLSLYCAL